MTAGTAPCATGMNTRSGAASVVRMGSATTIRAPRAHANGVGGGCRRGPLASLGSWRAHRQAGAAMGESGIRRHGRQQTAAVAGIESMSYRRLGARVTRLRYGMRRTTMRNEVADLRQREERRRAERPTCVFPLRAAVPLLRVAFFFFQDRSSKGQVETRGERCRTCHKVEG